MDLQSLAELSDSDLLARVKRLAQAECRATAALIAHLIEVENRKLYLGEACSSLFTYCVRVLHYSEPAAYNRIFAARAARTFPAVMHHLEQGAVHLAAVRLLAPVLTAENHRELLAAAAHKSKREVEELVARIRPLPDVPGAIRRLPSPARREPAAQSPASAPAPEDVADVAGCGLFESPRAGLQSEPSQPPPAQQQQQPPQRATVVPLAPERYKVQFMMSGGTRDKLRRAQELLRHRIPDGDVSQVIDLALDLLVRDLEKKKFAALAPRRTTAAAAAAAAAAAPAPAAATAAPSAPAAATAVAATSSIVPARAPARGRGGAAPGSRYIPAEVRRAVWQRDQGRCAFTGAGGERCLERAGLEFDHIQPHADGGGVEVNNIRLLCRQHNQYEARQFFGAWHAAGEPVPRCG